jgi:hypothetical protein
VTALTVATRTLAEVAADPATPVPAVTIPADAAGPGMDVVVLCRVDAATVEVYAAGGIRPYPDTTTVTDIADTDRRLRLVAEALLALDEDRRRLAQQALRTHGGHAEQLDAIRGYAIDRYREDMYCLDGLNRFLRTFDLPEYRPRVRVTYTVAGSYETEQTDTDDAESDAAGWLSVDLSGVSDVIAGSSRHDVEVGEAEFLDH